MPLHNKTSSSSCFHPLHCLRSSSSQFMFGLDGIDGRSGILGTFACDPGRLKDKTNLVSTCTVQQKNLKPHNQLCWSFCFSSNFWEFIFTAECSRPFLLYLLFHRCFNYSISNSFHLLYTGYFRLYYFRPSTLANGFVQSWICQDEIVLKKILFARMEFALS